MFLYTLYMFRVFITHLQERNCKLGFKFCQFVDVGGCQLLHLSNPVHCTILESTA
jgi:hypothetical protein